jgi:hypothetical protein
MEQKPLTTSKLGRSLRQVVERAARWHDDIWGWEFDCVPCEDELLTHITVPLLEALGWEPQQIAVKWQRTDVALFDPISRKPANCRMVIEGKRIGSGLQWAGDQARGYAGKLKLKKADVLVTDGISYKLFKAPDYSDETALRANLARPKESAVELFDALRP